MFFGMKKDKVIPIRVNRAQYASFATKAKSFNMDVSEWLRALGENSRPNELPIGVPCSNPKTPEVVKAPKAKTDKPIETAILKVGTANKDYYPIATRHKKPIWSNLKKGK